MAVKAIIFGTDDLFPKLQPHYDKQVKQGNFEIVGYVDATKEELKFFSTPDFKADTELDKISFNAVILSTQDNFFDRMKFLESKGLSRRTMIDGKVFAVEGLDFMRLVKEGFAHGTFPNNNISMTICLPFYGRVATVGDKIKISTGRCCIIESARIDSEVPVEITVGNFTEIGNGQVFEVGFNHKHNYKNVSASCNFAWKTAPNQSEEVRKVSIGNDVWINSNCKFKVGDKPLVIGDGAVIESGSVVTEDVPPYAIVGGNPAKVLSYRFSDKIIASLQKSKWWDWQIDKIHDTFKLFGDVEKFVAEIEKPVAPPPPAPKPQPAPQPVQQPQPAPQPVQQPQPAPQPVQQPQPASQPVQQPQPAPVKIINTQQSKFQLDLSQLKFV